MICSQDAIDQLADRIERAYRRRNPNWISITLTPGVWESAALRLIEASVGSPKIPIDPELYVAVLARRGKSPDPWVELTQTAARVRYMKALRKIILQLRRELTSEVRAAERLLDRGLSLDSILDDSRTRISRLTCYILAFRAGRPDLSIKHRAAAEGQHRSCPLYRQAAMAFLPSHAYPCKLSVNPSLIPNREIRQFSLN